MNTWDIILVLVVYFGAAFIKGMTGLGFSTLSLGVLAALIEIRLAISLVILPSLMSNVLVIADSGRLQEATRRFRLLFICTLCGLGAGMYVLGRSTGAVPRMVLGLVMVLYGLWTLRNGQYSMPRSWERRLSLPVGVLTGVVNGMTGSQIMPILPYLMSLNLERNLMVATINLSFTLSSLVMLVGLGGMGIIGWNAVRLAVPGVLLVLAGIRLGGAVRRRASDEQFRKMVLVLLVLLGCNLMLSA